MSFLCIETAYIRYYSYCFLCNAARNVRLPGMSGIGPAARRFATRPLGSGGPTLGLKRAAGNLHRWHHATAQDAHEKRHGLRAAPAASLAGHVGRRVDLDTPSTALEKGNHSCLRQEIMCSIINTPEIFRIGLLYLGLIEGNNFVSFCNSSGNSSIGIITRLVESHPPLRQRKPIS